MHRSPTTILLSDRNDDPVSPYLRRRLRSYAQYLCDRAGRKARHEDRTSDPLHDNPDVKNGGDNGNED